MSRKQKYDYEFKLRLVTIVLEGKNSIKGLQRAENIREYNIQFWVRLYEAYGKQGLKGVSQSNFTVDEKAKIIREYQKTGLSLVDLCVKYKISNPSVLPQWLRKFQNNGFKGLEDKRGVHLKKNKTYP